MKGYTKFTWVTVSLGLKISGRDVKADRFIKNGFSMVAFQVNE